MIVADASVLIAHLDRNDPHHERAVRLLSQVAEWPLAASPITVAEVLVQPARVDRLGEARAALSSLAVTEIPLAADAADRLAALRADTGLKLPDCCVLLAARDAPAEAVISFDERLLGVARGMGLLSTRVSVTDISQ